MVSSAKISATEGVTLPPVTISIGIAQMKSHEQMAELVRNADMALYLAKTRAGILS